MQKDDIRSCAISSVMLRKYRNVKLNVHAGARKLNLQLIQPTVQQHHGAFDEVSIITRQILAFFKASHEYNDVQKNMFGPCLPASCSVIHHD